MNGTGVDEDRQGADHQGTGERGAGDGSWFAAHRWPLILGGLAVVGVVVIAILRPNLVVSSVTNWRVWAFTALAVAVIIGLGRGVQALTGSAVAAKGAQLVPLLAIFVFVIYPTFVPTTVDEADPLAGVTALPSAEADPTPEPAPVEPAPVADAPAAPAEPEPAPVEPPAPAGPVLLAESPIAGLDYDASGQAGIIDLGDGNSVVRFSDFQVEAGPDYVVYLVDSPGATEPGAGINLGALKGTQGNQNYELPPGTNPAGDVTVLIWCRSVSAPVANASLSIT